MTNPIQAKVAETMSAVIAVQSPSAIVSDARAAEIRGELTREHQALWLHYYHRAVEQEVLEQLRKRGKTYHPRLDDQADTYDRILTSKGTELVATPQLGCVGCALYKGQKVDDVYCVTAPMCGSVRRTDSKSIIWKKP